MSAEVCLMAVAQEIPQNIKDRFVRCAELSDPKCDFDVVFLGEGEPLLELFNKSKFLNAGIKSLCKKDYKCIIQADIDLVIPPGIIDASLEYSKIPMTIFHNHHRRVDEAIVPKFPEQYYEADWEDLFSQFVPQNANGCWNSASPETWMKSGGWNERMTGWGREDDCFRRTAGKFGITFVNHNKFTLLHINHPFRGDDRRAYNRQIERAYEKSARLPNWLK